MKAICVTASRQLVVRDVTTPTEPPPRHVLVDMDSCAINHGDKVFLSKAFASAKPLASGLPDVWGASGAEIVAATGQDVPAELIGRPVAIYRSLGGSDETIGLWCERAQVPLTSCLLLPDDVQLRDYCGSLVNVITAYAFLSEISAAGHRGVIVTAGRSATGVAIMRLAPRWNLRTISLVRGKEASSGEALPEADRVISTSGDASLKELAAAAAQLGTTAVFDGVGGDLLTEIAPSLPINATVYIHGLLGGAAPISLSGALLLMNNLTIRRFSNFESATVSNTGQLRSALQDLAALIGDTAFTTRRGNEFSFSEIERAMGYEAKPGAKAILVP